MADRVFPSNVVLKYITDYITEDYKISSNGEWININSVFQKDNRYRLGFNLEKNYVNDFQYGESWSLIDFISNYQEISRKEAQDILLKIYFKHLRNGGDINPPKPKPIETIDLPEMEWKPNMKSFNLDRPARDSISRKAIVYLVRRNIKKKHIKKYDLMYSDQVECYRCNGSGKTEDGECNHCHGKGKNPYYGWLIIPSYENGNLVFFQGRNTNHNAKFRFRNPIGIPKSQVVLFYDLLKENDRIFITEGPFDAMTLYDYSVTCILGNRISSPQVDKILRKNPTEIVFIPDNETDPEKKRMIQSTLNKNIKMFHEFRSDLRIGVYEWWKRYPHGKDMNEIQHTKIEEDLIHWHSDSEKLLEKLYGVV